MRVEKAMARYLHVYESLYKRRPRQLRALSHNWVLVNGARMRVEELETLSEQLNREYQQVLANKRNVVKRLLAFFKT